MKIIDKRSCYKRIKTIYRITELFSVFTITALKSPECPVTGILRKETKLQVDISLQVEDTIFLYR